MDDLISRAAAIAEIEEYLEEYSELEPGTGYHNLKWCAMEEAKDVLTMLLAADAVPVEWLCQKVREEGKHENILRAEYIKDLIWEWRQRQEAQDAR